MPDGPGQDVSPPGAYLQYNEVSLYVIIQYNILIMRNLLKYIVYEPSQIRLKYLLMVKM